MTENTLCRKLVKNCVCKTVGGGGGMYNFKCNVMNLLRLKITSPCTINITIKTHIICLITAPAINRQMVTFTNSLNPPIVWS
jgi:hypothetical protein